MQKFRHRRKDPAFTGSSRFKAAKVAEMAVKTIITRFWQRPGSALPAYQDNWLILPAKTRGFGSA
jgi:hypothetical protein